MEWPVYKKIAVMAEQPDAVERSIAYMKKHMSQFLKKGEHVLICFSKKDNAACYVLEQTILALECTPVWVGQDRRWVTILKLAFTSKCNCIIGPPLMLLGLSKVARHMGTPLFARNVLMSGYPSTEWMVEAVERGLDCCAWGCFDPGIGAVISGFSCRQSGGVHLRTEEYGVDIVDQEGNVLPEGESGYVVIYPQDDPTLRFSTGDRGRLETTPCPCGCEKPRLLDLDTVKGENLTISNLGESLHYWSSILDCRVEKTECGLELVVFQGEKLPKLPSLAKLVVRSWNPAVDEPFSHHDVLKYRYFANNPH